MIIVTGGAGFIGSAFLWQRNEKGFHDAVVVDALGTGNKWQNLVKRQLDTFVHKSKLFAWLESAPPRKVTAIVHMGACSSTTEINADYLMENNFQYSQRLFQYAAERQIPFLYASSAATYGALESGFLDDHKFIDTFRPINKYGFSKQLFDQWALRQAKAPPFWAGFKFFNVYGPQEYHKGGQASVIFHAYPQVRDTGVLKLFKSYRPDVGHGRQKRDFVYVKDVVAVMQHFLDQHKALKIPSGVYNLGTGTARSWTDLGQAVFTAMGKGKAQFEWVEMPDSIRHQYQYFTQADLTRLREWGRYDKPFQSLEQGVQDYVQNYLMQADPYL